jgi:methionine aminopeptidase
MIIYCEEEVRAIKKSNQIVAKILNELGAMINPGLRCTMVYELGVVGQ